MTRTAALLTAAATLVACGSEPAPPAVTPAAFLGPPNTDSPISGATLHCPGDYPDSRLVFAPDGTLGGRYAGQPVTGGWTALAPDRVELLLRAGGIAVRDTVRRTAGGWQSGNTSCR